MVVLVGAREALAVACVVHDHIPAATNPRNQPYEKVSADGVLEVDTRQAVDGRSILLFQSH